MMSPQHVLAATLADVRPRTAAWPPCVAVAWPPCVTTMWPPQVLSIASLLAPLHGLVDILDIDVQVGV